MPNPVEDIKDRLDAVEVIGKYVPLKKAGHNFKGLCPFHSEKTPSFVVFPDDGHFHCFGCGQNGDIFTFVMKMENLEFGDALRLLADRAGVTLVTQPQVVAEDRSRDRLREINSAAAHFFHNLLLKSTEGQRARDFLARRGVNAGAVAAWELGYSLDSWDNLTDYLVAKGYAVEDVLAAGLVRRRESEGRPAPAEAPVQRGDVYDYFRGRVMFPIRDQKGNVSGFGARTLGADQPKFLNSPQTLVFDKGASLYGIDHAKETIRSGSQAVIVEGYLDVLIAHQMGIQNVVASLGTALTERQLGILKKLGKRLVLALDADTAGDEATLRGLSTAREVMDRVAVPTPSPRGLIHFEYKLDADLRILSLPRGEDPDNVILRSVAEWNQLVQEALPVVDFYFRAVANRLDLKDPKGKSAAVEQLLPLIREIENQVAQAHYLAQLSRLVQVDERLLGSRLRGLRPVGPATEPAARAAPVAARRAVSAEAYCLAQLLRHPRLYWQVEGLGPDDFTDPLHRQLFASIQETVPGGQPLEPLALRDSLDPALWDGFDALVKLSESQPQGADDEQELENEVVVSAVRIRLARRKEQLQRLGFALLDPETMADADQAAGLTAQADGLGQEIGQLQKSLAERTLLGRRKTAGG
jgi:DNA primase